MRILLLIFAVQITYVSLYTIRMICTLKGQKYIAAAISTVEVFIYVSGLTLVLSNLDNYLSIVVYCSSYALGILLGSKIEEFVALGYVTVQIILKDNDTNLQAALREKGYGVTSWIGSGRDGERLVMQVLTRRKHEAELFRFVHSVDNTAFIMSHEPKNFKGGFWVKKLI
ncbi:MAG: DUF2179 domain-containing protein [Bacillota bacterium]|nr:DUF2179 domain-containing protein [Bacillota bacterium]